MNESKTSSKTWLELDENSSIVKFIYTENCILFTFTWPRDICKQAWTDQCMLSVPNRLRSVIWIPMSSLASFTLVASILQLSSSTGAIAFAQQVGFEVVDVWDWWGITTWRVPSPCILNLSSKLQIPYYIFNWGPIFCILQQTPAAYPYHCLQWFVRARISNCWINHIPCWYCISHYALLQLHMVWRVKASRLRRSLRIHIIDPNLFYIEV